MLHQQAKQTKFDITVIVVSCTQRFLSAYIYIYTRTKRGTFDVERIQACVTRVLYNTRVPSYDHERYIVHGISVSNRSDRRREREKERGGREETDPPLYTGVKLVFTPPSSRLFFFFFFLLPSASYN